MGSMQKRGSLSGKYRDGEIREGRNLQFNMNIKSFVLKDKIFIAAILFSIIWHVFWLSIVTVVVTPEAKAPIKFSKVSFLGPLPGRGVIEASLMPKEQTFLEGRYLRMVKRLIILSPAVGQIPPDEGFVERYEKALTPLIEEALGASKLEAPYHNAE